MHLIIKGFIAINRLSCLYCFNERNLKQKILDANYQIPKKARAVWKWPMTSYIRLV